MIGLCLGLAAIFSSFETEDALLESVMLEVEHAIIEGDYEKAQTLLPGESDSMSKTPWCRYVRAMILFRRGAFDEAIILAKELEDSESSAGGSPFGMRAMSLHAEVLIAQEKYGEAASVWRATLDRLKSPSRRMEITEHYLELIGELEKGVGTHSETLVRLLDQVIDLGALPHERNRELRRRQIAHCEKTSGKTGLLDLCRNYLDDEWNSDIASILAHHLRSIGQAASAISLFTEISERERDHEQGAVALFEAVKTLCNVDPRDDRRFISMRIPSEFGLASAWLERLAITYPEHELAPISKFNRALLLATIHGSNDRGAESLLDLAQRQREHSWCPFALLKAGRVFWELGMGDRALKTLTILRDEFPKDALWQESVGLIEDYRFRLALDVHQSKSWTDSLVTWEGLLDEFPRHAHRPDASFYRGEALQMLGRDDECLSVWEALVRDSSGSEACARALLEIGKVHESKEQWESARRRWEQISHQGFKNEAVSLIRGLDRETLEVDGAMASTPGSPPNVVVRSRNVESFTWSIHRVDVLDYFNKNLTTMGIEQLDVSIAKPDFSGQIDLEGRANSRWTDSPLAFPSSLPGLYIITVRHGSIEARDVLLISDLQMITGVSKKRIWVRVFDQAKERWLDDVEPLLVVNGRFRELKEELPALETASLLVVREGHYAFVSSSGVNLIEPPEKEPLHLILMDRPTYANGDEVVVTVVARDVDLGLWQASKGEVELEVSAPNGLPYITTMDELSSLGNLSYRFKLPKWGAQGRWLVSLKKEKGLQRAVYAAESFDVIQRPPLNADTLEMMTRPRVLHPLVPFEIELNLRDHSGRPRQGSRIDWTIAGSASHREGTGLTDALGSIVIAVQDSQSLGDHATLIAALPSGRKEVFPLDLMDSRLRFDLKIDGSVRGPIGHMRTISVKNATAASGWRYRISERTSSGRLSWIESGEFSTSMKTPELFWSPPNPGEFEVEFIGTLGVETSVSRRTALSAFAPEDFDGLAIQCKTARCIPGEEVAFKVFSSKPCFGRIGLMGDRLFGERDVVFTQGWSEWSLPIPNQEWNSMEITALALTNDGIEEARYALDIDRHLELQVDTSHRVGVGGALGSLELDVRDEKGENARALVRLVIQKKPTGNFGEGPAFSPFQRSLPLNVWNHVAGNREWSVSDSSDQHATIQDRMSLPNDSPQRSQQGIDQYFNSQSSQGANAFQSLTNRSSLSSSSPLALTEPISVQEATSDDQGHVSFEWTWPSEANSYEIHVLAISQRRSAQLSLDAEVESSLTVIAPSHAVIGRETSIGLLGEGEVSVDLQGEVKRVSLVSGQETFVRFTPSRLGPLKVELRRDGLLMKRTVSILSQERSIGVSLIEESGEHDRVEALASRLIFAESPGERTRLAREVEMSVTPATAKNDLLAIFFALEWAKRKESAVDSVVFDDLITRNLSAFDPSDEALENRILRRWLLAHREPVQAIQLAPFLRQRNQLSARAGVLLMEMYRDLNRDEEQSLLRTSIREAVEQGRLSSTAWARFLDTKCGSMGLLSRVGIRGEESSDLIGEATSPFEAAIWGTGETRSNIDLQQERHGLAVGGDVRSRHYLSSSPKLDGRFLSRNDSQFRERRDYEWPSHSSLPVGSRFEVRTRISVSSEGWYREAIPNGCEAIDIPVDWHYESKGHSLLKWLHRGTHSLSYTAYPSVCALEELTLQEPEASQSILPETVNPAYLFGWIEHEARVENWPMVLNLLDVIHRSSRLYPRSEVELSLLGFKASCELSNSRRAIELLERIKELEPDQEIDPRRARFAAEAYENQDEPWASMDLYRALSDEFYLQSSLLTGELEKVGRQVEAQQLQESWLMAHAPSTMTRDMLAALAQRRERISRGDWPDASRLYRHHLVLYGDAPDRDQILHGLANLENERGRNGEKDRLRVSEKLAALGVKDYPGSVLSGGFKMLHGVSLFGQRRFDEALVSAKALSTLDRNLSLLLNARIHHAQGNMSDALKAYREVASLFPDAKRTLDFIEKSGIGFPETTVTQVGDLCEVEIEHLAVPEVEIKVYGIDLMGIYGRDRPGIDLGELQVAGFAPLSTKHHVFSKSSSTTRLRESVDLELTQPGAYYVTVRGGSFSSTGLILISDLAMEVQADAGVTRVYLSDSKNNNPAPDVDVTFFQQGVGQDSVTNPTDQRGIAEFGLNCIHLVIVAEHGEQYALATVKRNAEDTQLEFDALESKDAIEKFIERSNSNIIDRESTYMSNQAQFERSIKISKEK